MKTNKITKEGGFTLLELLLVIGVGALLLIGGIATYRLVTDGNKATDSTRLLLTLRQEAQTLAQQQGGVYTGVTYDTTISSTTSPMVVSGTLRDQQRNPYNGIIKIDPIQDSNGTTDANLTIKFDNVSQAGCSKLAAAVNNASEVVKVTINATDLTTFPIMATSVSAACTVAPNTVTWQFP